MTMKRMATLALLVLAIALLCCGCGASTDTPASEVTTTTTAGTTTTTQHGVLDASDVIVRDGPGFDYYAIGGITYGEDIVILGREGDWYKIRFGDGVGYINAQYVDVDDAPNADEMIAARTTTTTTTTVAAAGGTTVTGNTGATTVPGGTTGVGEVTATTRDAGYIPGDVIVDSDW